MRQARDDPLVNKHASTRDHNRNRRGRLLRRPYPQRPPCDNDIGPEPNQLGGEIGEPVQLPFCEAALKGDVVPLTPTKLAELLQEWRLLPLGFRGREAIPECTYQGNLNGLLRVGGTRYHEEAEGKSDGEPDGAEPDTGLLTSVLSMLSALGTLQILARMYLLCFRGSLTLAVSRAR